MEKSRELEVIIDSINQVINAHKGIAGVIIYHLPYCSGAYSMITLFYKAPLRRPREIKTIEQIAISLEESDHSLYEKFYKELWEKTSERIGRTVRIETAGEMAINEEILKETLKNAKEIFTINIVTPHREVCELLREYVQ